MHIHEELLHCGLYFYFGSNIYRVPFLYLLIPATSFVTGTWNFTDRYVYMPYIGHFDIYCQIVAICPLFSYVCHISSGPRELFLIIHYMHVFFSTSRANRRTSMKKSTSNSSNVSSDQLDPDAMIDDMFWLSITCTWNKSVMTGLQNCFYHQVKMF